MATVKITYTPVVEAPVAGTSNICGVFTPDNCAANMETFEGTYYDTNVFGMGEGTNLEDFVAMQVSHPGLVAAIKKAIKDGSYELTVEDPMMETFVEETSNTLADRGITLTWTAAAAGATS